ncbi:MAG: polysaccharide deacetylase family protein [Pseudomonadota bacterium]
MNVHAYSPPRDLRSKVQRRWTQWRAATPARLSFERPILSICFDDFPHNAAVSGAAILERYGARGTFYAAADLAGREGPCGQGFSADDLQRLAKGGHEIGCHTYSHRDCARLSAYEALRDIARNQRALNIMGHEGALQTLAYPYGETSHALKSSLPPRFVCARGIQPGLNIGRVDLAQLRAYPLFDAAGVARANSALKRAAKQKAWMIAFTHDVSDTPSPWGTDTKALDAFVARARTLGFLIAPVRNIIQGLTHAAH